MNEIRNEEIKVENGRYLVSETDASGVITYCNDYFIEISGYKRNELIGKQHNIIRHPDMPKIIFKLLWKRIKSGKNINALVKNLAKDGRYYWIFTSFQTRIDLDTNTVMGYTAHRKMISSSPVEIISALYKDLLKIEQEKGVQEAEDYLNNYLHKVDKKMTFVDLLDNIHKFF